MTTRVDSQVIDVTYRLNHQQATSQLAAVASAQDRLASSKARSVFDGLTESAKNMAGRMAPAAAAISSVSAALGNAGGAAGKMVAAGGQVVAAFGAGGFVGAALAAGTIAVDALSASWIRQTAAQDAALDRAFASINAQIAATATAKASLAETRTELVAAMRIGEDEAVTFQRSLETARKAGADNVAAAQQRLDKLKSTALDLSKVEQDAAKLDMTFQQARMWRSDLREKEIASAERALKTVQTQAMLLPQVLVIEDKRKKAAEQKAAAEERFKAALEGQRNAYEAMYRFREQADEQLIETTTDEISRTMRGQKGVAGGGLGDAMLQGARDRAEREADLETSTQLWLTKIRKEAAEHRLDNDKVAAEKQAELKKKSTEAMLDVERSYWNQVRDVGASAMGSLLSATQGYIEAKIKGEKDAELKAVASFLSSTGQMLVASGTRGILEGAIISSNPLTPGAGAGMIATGAGAVAVGLAMGAGGAALAHTAAGGKVGQALPAEPRIKDLNTPSPRSSGNSDGITINYMGASGATAEESHKAVLQALNKARKRGWRPR